MVQKRQPTEVAAGLYECPIPMPDNPLAYLLAYLLETDAGLWVIDTGWNTAEAIAAWEDHLQKLGFRFDQIHKVIITHIHPDHYGLASEICRRSGAELLMSATEANFLKTRYQNVTGLLQDMGNWLAANGVPSEELDDLQQASMPVIDRVNIAFPDMTLHDGDVLHGLPWHLEVIETPGHSTGHICLYDRRQKILLAGDHVLPGITPHIGFHPEATSNPLEDYFASLDKLAHLEINLALPAHEYPFNNAHVRARQIKEHHQQRLQEIIDNLNGHYLSAYQIAAQLQWKVGPWSTMGTWDRRTALMETKAHLVYLIQKGQVKRDKKDGITYYARP